MNPEVQEWLSIADKDLKCAYLMFESAMYDRIGYFCQQCIEKALKAIIFNNTGLTPPKLHALGILAKKANIYESLTEAQITLMGTLTQLYQQTRYPMSDEIDITNEEYTQMLIDTEEVYTWIKQKL